MMADPNPSNKWVSVRDHGNRRPELLLATFVRPVCPTRRLEPDRLAGAALWTRAPGDRPRLRAVNRGQDSVRRCRISSRTRAASAWPRVAFITAPTRTPAAAVLPERTLAATSGLASIAS